MHCRLADMMLEHVGESGIRQQADLEQRMKLEL